MNLNSTLVSEAANAESATPTSGVVALKYLTATRGDVTIPLGIGHVVPVYTIGSSDNPANCVASFHHVNIVVERLGAAIALASAVGYEAIKLPENGEFDTEELQIAPLHGDTRWEHASTTSKAFTGFSVKDNRQSLLASSAASIVSNALSVMADKKGDAHLPHVLRGKQVAWPAFFLHRTQKARGTFKGVDPLTGKKFEQLEPLPSPIVASQGLFATILGQLEVASIPEARKKILELFTQWVETQLKPEVGDVIVCGWGLKAGGPDAALEALSFENSPDAYAVIENIGRQLRADERPRRSRGEIGLASCVRALVERRAYSPDANSVRPHQIPEHRRADRPERTLKHSMPLPIFRVQPKVKAAAVPEAPQRINMFTKDAGPWLFMGHSHVEPRSFQDAVTCYMQAAVSDVAGALEVPTPNVNLGSGPDEVIVPLFAACFPIADETRFATSLGDIRTAAELKQLDALDDLDWVQIQPDFEMPAEWRAFILSDAAQRSPQEYGLC